MPGEKKRGGRRAYLNDFSPRLDGGYDYNGALHAFQEGSMSRRQAMTRLWALSAVSAMLIIAAGCVPAAGTANCPYVLLPYAGSAVSAVSVIWLMARLSGGGDPLRDYVYKATVEQYALRSMLVIVFTALSLAGDALYLILNGVQGLVWGTAAFWLCQGGAVCSVCLWRRAFSRLRWKIRSQNL